MLEISLDFDQNASDKQSKLSKTLLVKRFKFILTKKDNIIIFNLSFFFPQQKLILS